METCSSSSQPNLARQLMLARDPLFIGRRPQIDDRLPADGRGGEASYQCKQRLPLKRRKVRMFHD